MRKNLLLLFALLILGIVAWYLMHNQSPGSSTINIPDRNFSVEESSIIYAFNIIQKNAPALSFERNGDHWIVNGIHRADKNLVSNLMDVFINCSLDYIPDVRAKNNILEEIDRIGIKVELFNKSGKNIRSYYVGGNTSSESGTFFLMENATQPYVMVIPGLTGSLRNRFNLTELKVRDRLIFRDMSNRIESIRMEYPKDKSKGFSIEKVSGKYRVESLYKTISKRNNVDVNQKLAQIYFDEFNKIASEYIENLHPKKDSIASLTPFAHLTLKLKDGSEQSLSLVPMNEIIDSELKIVDLEQLGNVERYFATSSWGDLYLVQHRLIKGLFRPYEYFLQSAK